jgi:hypothetical protein
MGGNVRIFGKHIGFLGDQENVVKRQARFIEYFGLHTASLGFGA